MKIAYAVEWIEVEFGMRPMGYRIFLDLEECINPRGIKKRSVGWGLYRPLPASLLRRGPVHHPS